MNKIQHNGIARLRTLERRAILKPLEQALELLNDYHQADWCVCDEIGGTCRDCLTGPVLEHAFEIIRLLREFYQQAGRGEASPPHIFPPKNAWSSYRYGDSPRDYRIW